LIFEHEVANQLQHGLRLLDREHVTGVGKALEGQALLGQGCCELLHRGSLTTLASMPNRDDVIEALRAVEDPELGMDIVELGLLYDVEVAEPRVHVRYSLTSMGCPAGPLIQQSIEEVVQSMPGVEQVETELTWDPPWTPDKMSEDAKFILGFG
jgi:metal-sulfur cluster biosynthetic enzyme